MAAISTAPGHASWRPQSIAILKNVQEKLVATVQPIPGFRPDRRVLTPSPRQNFAGDEDVARLCASQIRDRLPRRHALHFLGSKATDTGPATSVRITLAE